VCTLTLAWRAFEDAPVVVAANRDELLDRDSEPPAVVDGDPSFVAPRDAVAGGTWIGYNEHGVFVGLTNRWVDVPDGGERSRGLLVRDALRAESAVDARETIEDAVAADTYDGFHLVVAERGEDDPRAYFFEWDGALNVRRLTPGVHVVVNVGIDGEFVEPEWRPEVGAIQAHNAQQVRTELDSRKWDSASTWLDRAKGVLGTHEYGVCVHESDRDFGTRSSSLITLSADGDAEFQFADGAPCDTAFDRVEGQI